MFLNDTHITSTFIREGFGMKGERETVLVIQMDENPTELREKDPKNYQTLSEKLSYLDNLAKNGFLEFNRIELTSAETKH